MNDQAGQGDWRIRAQFSSASNADLGYQTGCSGYSETSPTWQQVKCYVIPPPNAARLRLQVWLVQHSGWVAVDDLTVDDLSVAGWDGSTQGLPTEYKRCCATVIDNPTTLPYNARHAYRLLCLRAVGRDGCKQPHHFTKPIFTLGHASKLSSCAMKN